ncbi:MAG: VCBS repeat-containing protein, partial [Thermodesulfovibrionales bacterium]
MKSICIFVLMFLLQGAAVFAGEQAEKDIFSKFADDTVAFFAPISGQVINVSEDKAEINIGQSEGVRNGMRLKVFRESEEFRHPVTGEVLGKIESEVGSAEVTTAEEKKSGLKILSGEIKVEDIVRISKGTLKMVFYQSKSVDWAVGDALYREFKGTGRFEVIETDKDEEDTEVMLSEVKKRGSVFGVFVKQYRTEDKEMIEVSLYHPDGDRFYNRSEELTPEKLSDLKFGYSFLKEVDTALKLSFEVPASTSLVSACDVDGDGTTELVMAIGSEIEIFRYGVELKLLHFSDIGQLKEVVWMDCDDVDGDGKSEILVTSVVGDRIDDEADESSPESRPLSVSDKGAVSEIFGLEEEGLISQARKYGFMKVIDGSVYYQAFSELEGYSGDVFLMKYDGELKLDRPVKLPGGTNIYDFMPVKTDGADGFIVVDDAAHVNLFNSQGLRIWRSKYKLGAFQKEYELPAPSMMVQAEKWYVKDRIVPYKGSYIMIRRELVADNVPGLGSSSADIVGMKVT